MATRSWAPLQPGDIVDVIAPASRTTDKAFQDGVAFLKKWGLVPRVPKNLFGKTAIVANTDEIRFEHLRDALLARDSKAVWCIRGGYGSARLIPALTKVKKPSQPKLFIGLSDITSLHVFLGQKWEWPTIHGPLLDRLGRGAALPKYEKELKSFVFGAMDEISFKGLKPMNDVARESGTVRGAVSGGNLVNLHGTIGTANQWDTRGRILFFEEIGERGYRVDRIFEQMYQAGMFKKAKAIVFGQFTEGEEPDGKDFTLAVQKRLAERLKIPVFSGLPSGHDKIQRPVPFETPAILTLGLKGELVVATGVQK